MKEKYKLVGSYSFLKEGERRIALKDTRQNYKIAQDIALNIEAIIWHTLNRNKTRIDPNYSMKNRELMNYLMDDNNYELRIAVLTGDKSPEALCRASAKVSYLVLSTFFYFYLDSKANFVLGVSFKRKKEKN